MIEAIRGILINISQVAGSVYRTFAAHGRPKEVISGKLFQHYGFRSYPKAQIDLEVIQYGNNAISVAEHDGNLAPTLTEGQVAIYASGKANEQVSMIMTPNGSGDGLISIICKTGSITISAGNNVSMVMDQNSVTIKAANVYLGDEASGAVQKLCNETFAQLLAGHTHALDIPHAVSLAPLQYSGPIISPINSTLYPNDFTSATEAK